MEGRKEGGEMVRIFVGGLSGSITASDVERLFSSSSSSLGRVRAVEMIMKNNNSSNDNVNSHNTIIRSKGQHSFAYVDFEPISQNALSKLFATYNGCAWKGGRLRLEKAKEHYLDRLKREWEQDAKLVNGTSKEEEENVDVVDNQDKNMDSLHLEKRLNRLAQEKMQLRIFFPKLKKVKSLPYKGTGKHKYSFQRVEVPLLPFHFCDCDEHCSPETACREDISVPSTQFGLIKSKELDIMSSVMNKLFKREDNMKARDNAAVSTNLGNNSNHSVDGVSFDGMKAVQLTEEDNLVTNIAIDGTNNRLGSVQVHGWGLLSKYQDSKYSKLQSSNDGRVQKQTKAHKRKNSESSTNASEPILKKKAHLVDKRDTDELSMNPQKRSLDVHSKQLENATEIQPIETQLKSGDNQSARGTSWVQKSSWRDLIGEPGSSLFSISHVLPGITSTIQNLPQSKGLAVVNSSGKGQNSVKCATVNSGVISKCWDNEREGRVIGPCESNVGTSGRGQNAQAALEGGRSTQEDNLQITADHFFKLCKEPDKNAVKEHKATKVVAGIGEVCTFIRSANSEREWTKARAALSGSLKKRSNENNASKKTNGMTNRTF